MRYILIQSLGEAAKFLLSNKYNFQGAPNRWCKPVDGNRKQQANIVSTESFGVVIICNGDVSKDMLQADHRLTIQ